MKKIDIEFVTGGTEENQLVDVRARVSGLVVGRISDKQVLSIKALFSYASHVSGVPEEMVATLFCIEFGVPSADLLQADSYDAALKWLVNVDPLKSMH